MGTWNLPIQHFDVYQPFIKYYRKQDGRVVSVAVPTTWPPQDINGVIISGFDSPVSTGIDRTFCYPQNIYDEIERNFGGYVLC